jgi:hypothetical protein
MNSGIVACSLRQLRPLIRLISMKIFSLTLHGGNFLWKEFFCFYCQLLEPSACGGEDFSKVFNDFLGFLKNSKKSSKNLQSPIKKRLENQQKMLNKPI